MLYYFSVLRYVRFWEGVERMHNKKSKKWIAPMIILILANALLFFTIWLMQKYDHVYFDQILYQMKSPTSGAYNGITTNAAFYIIVYGGLVTAAEIILYRFLSGKLQKFFHNWKGYIEFCAGRFCKFFVKTALPLSLVLFIVSVTVFLSRFEVAGYVKTANTESDFIQQNYVDPNSTKLTFPEKKRNLIYIFLESLESTYANPEAGGNITQNFIPNLTEYAQNNVHFSNTQGIGGAYMYSGTTWTAAAMVAQTSGVVIKVPLTAENYGGQNAYIPGLTSIGEILEKQGYAQTLLVGSDAAFAGRDTYFTEHGNYNIADINSLKKEGRLDKDYREWWGFEDEKLFAYAKEEILALAAKDQPFNLTMLTVDTHFPDGYVCRLCDQSTDNQYSNVLQCSDRQIKEFISWIQSQPFYENTTIVLVGDHLTMDPKYLEDIDEGYQRTVYNCIINGAATPVKNQNRQFGTFDMFPTTLAALGVQIDGNRLALGTNLYADAPTLTELYGRDVLDVELQKKSSFYNHVFLGIESSSSSNFAQ